MKAELYVIHDKVAGRTTTPYTFANVGEASRKFTQMCRDDQELAMDLELYKIADYETETCVITPCEYGKKFVMRGVVVEK